MNNRGLQMLKILQLNKGFSHPEKWLDYAIAHDFRPIHADKLFECPDCASGSSKSIGQFVYYSTLVNLKACSQCGLVYTDTRIDSKVIQTHFEQAYKDENYFLYRRTRIFEQIARLVDDVIPANGTVLDIGGAKGHLLTMLRTRRPDLSFYLNDVSQDACRHAASKYGFQTLAGGINELEKVSRQFDAVILSDVIYYEPELHRLLTRLPHLVSPTGTVIIRLPNNFNIIRAYQFMKYVVFRVANREMQDKIQFFNPEHLYVFSRKYLVNRLKQLDFADIDIIPAALPVHETCDVLHRLYAYLAKIISMISFGKIIITPSFIITARHHNKNLGGQATGASARTQN